MFGFAAGQSYVGDAMSPRDESLGARLRELPVFEPAAGGWPAFERRRRRRALQRTTGCSLAASVLLAVVVAGWQLRSDRAAPVSVAALESQSQALERTLQRARQQTVIWDGEQAQRSAELESQLALVDLQIAYADPKAAPELWQDRLTLMTALVAAHSDPAAADGTELVEY